MHRSTARLLSVLNIITMVVFMFIFRNSEVGIFLIMIAGLVIGVILNYFLRCPHCGRWPGRDSLFPKYCPRCGKELDD